MDITTLIKANELNKRITDLTNALECFKFYEEETGKYVSREPKLIISHIADDWNGRDTTEIPMSISDDLITLLEQKIRNERAILVNEFNAL